MTEPRVESVSAPPSGSGSALAARAGALSGWTLLALVVALCAAGLAILQWYRDRGADDALRREVAQRLADMTAREQAAAVRADQFAAALREAEIKIGILESKLAESQSQQIALEALYQELSRNRDEWAFAEIEQSVLLASQQLQVAGNVRVALIGLENAEARLQRMEQPRYSALRRALVRDIERLKTLPLVDVHGSAGRIDDVIAAVDRLQLAMDARARADAPAAAPLAELPAWERMLREAWQELRQLVRVQRTGVEEAALLAPEQAFFLRENLKLRLLAARIALLSRDGRSYQADLRAALAALERHFDLRDAGVAAAAATLRRLQAAPVEVVLPDLFETLEALRRLRSARGKPPA
jgi:uroporphyrin-3 C-methyltransferase